MSKSCGSKSGGSKKSFLCDGLDDLGNAFTQVLCGGLKFVEKTATSLSDALDCEDDDDKSKTPHFHGEVGETPPATMAAQLNALRREVGDLRALVTEGGGKGKKG